MATNIPHSSVPSFRQQSRQDSLDPRNDVFVQMDHYIGIDVGTGSARACIIDDKGDIVGLASKNIGLWQPETGYYVGPHTCSSEFRADQRTGTIDNGHLEVYL